MTATQESIYEHLFALTTIMKQRVVDNFNSGVLNERWALRNESGSGTSGMVNAVNEGGFVKSGSAGGAVSSIDFNNIRQYSNTDSVFIAVLKRLNSPGTLNAGLANGIAIPVKLDSIMINNNSTQTFYRLITRDATTANFTSTDVNVDLVFHVIKGIMTSSDAKIFIDNILKATNTTNLPTLNMCPVVTDSLEGESRCRYFEAFNT